MRSSIFTCNQLYSIIRLHSEDVVTAPHTNLITFQVEDHSFAC